MSKGIDLAQYQAIIFDLGGVLLNIDYQASKRAFEKLGVADFDMHFSQLSQSHLFDRFETGMISSEYFREQIKKESRIKCAEHHIDAAWNAMLLDFPIQRLALLERLSTQLPLFLFSNTNEIHIRVFKNQLTDHGLLKRFENCFTQIYYSYELGMRKPHPKSFKHILELNGLDASLTLFIDDSKQHIEGAKKAGLRTILLDPSIDITQLFEND